MANGVIEEEGTTKDIFENPQSPILKAFLGKASAF
jgi:ABC-type histidine transport system ATPase subunit